MSVIRTWVWLHRKQWCEQYMNSTKNAPSVVLKPAQVAPVSTKAQKISRKIIISKIFSCQDDNAEEDIDFINMPLQIPFSDDNFF